jgi:hypothetical protein
LSKIKKEKVNRFFLLPLIFFYLFITRTPAVADYKIELVNGGPIIVKWYTIDRDREIVLYRQKEEIIEVPADNVVNILYFDPIAHQKKLAEEQENKEMEAAFQKWNDVLEQAVLNTQEQHDEWKASQTAEPAIKIQKTQEPVKKDKSTNDERSRQNGEQQKKFAQTDMERCAEKLENAKALLWDVRRESYVSSSDHKKRVRYARSRVEDAERQYEKARERFNDACR